MKLSTSFLLFLAAHFPVFAQGVWNQKANCGGLGRSGAIGFSIGTKGYIGTGYVGTSTNTSDFWEWDQSTDTWSQKANFIGGPWDGASAFSIGNKGYVVFGRDATFGYMNYFMEWDQATNTWTWIGNFPGFARLQATAFSIGTKGYAGTGYNGSNYMQDFWEWNQSTNTWSQKANYGGGNRGGVFSFSLGGRGYIGTGYDGTAFQNDFWEYDPGTNTWIQKTNLPAAIRANAIAFSIGTKGYCGLGNNGNNYYTDIWEWDQATNTWIPKANFTGLPRAGAECFSIGTKGYIGTGYSNVTPIYLSDFWEFSPNAPANDNSLSAVTLTPNSLCSFTSGTSFDATASLPANCGGNPDDDVWYKFTSSSVVTSAIITVAPSSSYDAVVEVLDNSMSSVACGNSGGNGATESFYATDLNLGATYYVRVYHSGAGSGSNLFNICVTLPSVSPITWTSVANFGGTARHLAAAFSVGNKGYVATGEDGPLSYRDDLWEYDQAANAWTQKANLGLPRCFATGFSIGSKGYVGNGSYDVMNNGHYEDLLEYDPVLNNWIQKANYGGGKRLGVVSFAIGTRAYVGLGDSLNATIKNDLWEWDQNTNTWAQKADIPGNGGVQAVGFAIGNKGYAGTGQFNGGNLFWEYDPAVNTWAQKASYGGGAIYGAVGLSVNGQGFIGTGFNTPSYKKAIWQYDPASDTWFKQTDFPGTGRYNAVAFTIGNNGYVGAGYDGNYKSDFWRFTGGSITTGYNPLKQENLLNVYPNPSSGIFTIELDSLQSVNNLSVTDVLGNAVYYHKEFETSQEINLRDLPNGIYFVKIQQANGREVVQKIVIQ
ncbi:MAG: T9SS type A sorting domain-containing protein [Bacteroidota bacterium]